jgi:two-component system chemotaxis response regulator CheY
MKEILAWLLGIEEEAARLYEQSADFFSEGQEFAEFLRRLSLDEKKHLEILHVAKELTVWEKESHEIVSLDSRTRHEIASNLLLWRKRLADNSFTRTDLVDLVISLEYSEWNTLFLYVINTLRHVHKEFIPAAAKFQRHKKAIEHFLESHPEFHQQYLKIKTMPDILEENLLVVDDDPSIAALLVSVLENEGIVDHAVNGDNALKKLQGRYYAAIISDLDMPVMNGIEFYKQAIEIYPNMKERFIFFTSSFDQDILSFFRQNNLRYLQKPSSITDVRKAVSEILSR